MVQTDDSWFKFWNDSTYITDLDKDNKSPKYITFFENSIFKIFLVSKSQLIDISKWIHWIPYKNFCENASVNKVLTSILFYQNFDGRNPFLQVLI